MLRTKIEVDKHVAGILDKMKNENERSVRGFIIARLYYNVKDFDSAKRYLHAYLAIQDKHAGAHKLMGKIHEATGNLEQALVSYKKSFELDSYQQGLVLKVCELYCNVPVDAETAKFWVDRAQKLFPGHNTVFKLKESLLKANRDSSLKDVETLIAAELAARPNDADLQVRRLRILLEMRQVEDALKYAREVENKGLFEGSISWYRCLVDVSKAYVDEKVGPIDVDFMTYYLSCTAMLIELALSEPHALPQHSESGEVNDSGDMAVQAIQSLDSALHLATTLHLGSSASWMFVLHHMMGEYFFHLATLILRRARREQLNRNEASQFGGALLLCAYSRKPPADLQHEGWFLALDPSKKEFFSKIYVQANWRLAVCGYILMCLCERDRSQWLSKIKQEVCITQARARIYTTLFGEKVNGSSSWFLQEESFVKASLEFPCSTALEEYAKLAQKKNPQSLNNVVWLGLHSGLSGGKISKKTGPRFEAQVFQDLLQDSLNLTTGNPASFNQMDVAAFLEATCICAATAVEQRPILRGPMCLPPYAGTALCTQLQANWWKAAYLLHSKSTKVNLGELLRVLQRGLEVVRGIGNHGLDVRLVLQLARVFAEKSIRQKEFGHEARAKALEGRAALYWQLVISLLERDSGSPAAPRERLFPFAHAKTLSSEEIKFLYEEGKLFLGIRAMNADCLEEAAAIFSELSSAHASFYQALVLKKLAPQEDANQCRLLLQKAKDALYLTLDRIRGDSTNPLTQQLRDEIEDVEDQLNVSVFNCNNLEDGEHYVTVNEYTGPFTPAEASTAVTCSTPRVDNSFFSRRKICQPSTNEQQQPHLMPSPERLDSQVRSLSQTQDTIIQTLSQLKDANRLIVDELKQHQKFMEQILKKVEDLSTRPPSSARTRQHREDSEYVEDYEGNYEGDYDHYTEYAHLEPSMGGTGVAPSPHPAMGYGGYRPPAAQPYGAYPPPTLGYPLPPHHYAAPIPPAPLMGPRAIAPPPPPLPHQAFYPPANVPAGLPLTERQGLPQFRFDITQPPPPPGTSDGRVSAFSRLGYSAGSTVLPPPVQTSTLSTLSVKTPKSGAPHAFQIPLPTSTTSQAPAFLSATTTATSSDKMKPVSSTPQLESLLKGMPNSSAEATTPSPLSRRTRTVSSGSEDFCDETEVEGNFKPLIPLPEEVTTCTGEEDEQVCFEERAKLFRFVDKEWKERGTGVLKLLENKEGKVRLLMRRDQVLKVCANHYILGKMSLTPLRNMDTAWIWDAQDFADGEPHPEKFCVRFKTTEIAARFKEQFNKAVQQSLARVAAATTLAATNFGLPTLSPSPMMSVAAPSPIRNAPMAVAATPTSTFSTTPKTTPALSSGVTTGQGFFSSGGMPSSTNTVSGGAQLEQTAPKSGFSAPTTPAFPFGAKQTVGEPAGGKNVFGGFTFSVPPKVKEPAAEPAKPAPIVEESTPAVKPSPFAAFSFKTSGAQKEAFNADAKPTPTVSQPSESTKPTPFASISSPAAGTQNGTGNVNLKPPADGVQPPESIKPFASFSFASPSSQKEADDADIKPSAFTLGARAEISKLSLSTSKSPALEKPVAAKVATKPQTPTATAPAKKSVTSASPGEIPEEFVPNVDFTPVVPLPDLVETKTGEEEEETLFDERAKLFRFDPESKEWKERGIGQLKILRHPDTGVCRILMRRDQVLKLCANHRILPKMKLGPMCSGSRAWVWCAQDYSDGSLRDEQLAVRFKTREQADSFKAAFEKCQQQATSTTLAREKAGQGTAASMKASEAVSEKSPQKPSIAPSEEKAGLGIAAPKKDSVVKPSEAPVPLSQLSQFKPKPGAWSCNACYVTSPADATSCVACQTPRPGAKQHESTPSTGCPPSSLPLSQLSQFKPKPGAWSCDACYVTSPPDATLCIACQMPRPGAAQQESAPATESPLSSLAKLVGSGKESGTGFPVAAQSTAPAKFMFGFPSKPSEPSVAPVVKPGTFVFGQPTTSPSAPTFTFGTASSFGFNKTEEEEAAPGVEFKFGSPQKYEFSFSGVRPRSPNKTPKSPCTPVDAANASREEEDAVESPDADIYFQPVIPLPPKVQTCTGEEEEQLLYCHRAKLFRWQGGEWKERGLGDIKVLLKSEAPKRVRLVMRREPVLKVCLNHILTPVMAFSKKDERIVTWSAVDFSDGEASPHQFALRLKTADAANEFLDAIGSAKKHLESGRDIVQSGSSAVKDTTSTFSFKLDPKDVTPPSSGAFSLSNRFGGVQHPVARSLFGNTGLPTASTVEDDIEIEYEAKATNEQIARARKYQLPDNFYLYETRPPCPGCRGCENGTPMKKGQQDAAPVKTATTSSSEKKQNGFFTAPAEDSRNVQHGGDSLFGKSEVSQLSFASLASQGAGTSGSFLQGTSTSKNSPLLAGAGTPVFQASTRRRSESGGDDGEVAQSIDVHFEPVVPLPDLVEVTTGEEDEEALFRNRGKLYAYHSESKQWKERAVGDVKILKHLQKPGQFRVVMRRDQVHKIACNHKITTLMKLKPLSTSANSVTWNAIDYSDGKASPQNFAIRFKNMEILKCFQDTFESCQKILAEMPQHKTDSQSTQRLNNSDQTTGDSHEEGKEDEEEEDEDEEEEGVDEEEEEEGEEIMFEKRITFAVFNPATGKYENAGMGSLCVLYDDSCYGMRIRVTADETDEVLCETLIAVQTCLRTEKLDAYWTAIDMSQNPGVRRQFKVTFSSVQAVEEFSRAFDEGKECAVSAAIVETTDEPPY